MEDFSVKKISAEMQYVRAGHEWGYIFLDDRTGLFMAHSSFGSFCYHWSARGPHTLLQFLCQLKQDYFLGKTMGREATVFDHEQTVASIKADLFKRRKFGEIEKDEARRWFDELEEIQHEHVSSEEVFFYHARECDFFKEMLDGEWEGLPFVRKPNPQGVGFWTHILQPFLDTHRPKAIDLDAAQARAQA